MADGLAITFVYAKDSVAPSSAAVFLLWAAFGFNVIMFVNFWKFAYRSFQRYLRLRTNEDQKNLRRLGPEREPVPIRSASTPHTNNHIGCFGGLLPRSRPVAFAAASRFCPRVSSPNNDDSTLLCLALAQKAQYHSRRTRNTG